MIRHHVNFFSKKNFVNFEFFFSMLRINIVILFDVTTKKTTTKKRTKAIFTKIKRTRKISRIVLSTETLKKKSQNQ